MNDKEKAQKKYKTVAKQFEESVNDSRFIYMLSVKQLDDGRTMVCSASGGDLCIEQIPHLLGVVGHQTACWNKIADSNNEVFYFDNVADDEDD